MGMVEGQIKTTGLGSYRLVASYPDPPPTAASFHKQIEKSAGRPRIYPRGNVEAI